MPSVETVIGRIVAVHALLMSESDISPSNAKIGVALRDLVELLVKPYSAAETAAILNHPHVAALRPSLIARLSEAEAALEWFWSQRFLNRKSLGTSDLAEFLYWRNYERLLGMEVQALAAMRWRQARQPLGGRGIAFVGGGPLPLSAILLHAQTGESVVCIDADAEACEISKQLLTRLGLNRISTVHTNGMDFSYESVSTIFVASLVARKTAVARRIVETREGPVVAVRSVEGVRTLLYDPADQTSLEVAGLSFAGQTQPDDQTINTTLFYSGCRPRAKAFTPRSSPEAYPDFLLQYHKPANGHVSQATHVDDKCTSGTAG